MGIHIGARDIRYDIRDLEVRILHGDRSIKILDLGKFINKRLHLRVVLCLNSKVTSLT